MERGIRATKRELKGSLKIYESDQTPANVAEVNQLKDALKARQTKLRDFIDEASARGKAPVLQRSERREWAGDMPKVKVPPPARRTVQQALSTPSVEKRRNNQPQSKRSNAEGPHRGQHGMEPARGGSWPRRHATEHRKHQH